MFDSFSQITGGVGWIKCATPNDEGIVRSTSRKSHALSGVNTRSLMAGCGGINLDLPRMRGVRGQREGTMIGQN